MTSGNAQQRAEPAPVDLRIGDVRLENLPEIIALDTAITGISKPELWYAYYGEIQRGLSRSFLVAQLGGQVVGYIIGDIRAWEFGSAPCGWIVTIGVAPQHRLEGIASALFSAVVERFRPSGVTTVRTMTHIDEPLLMSFFRSHGMTAGPFIELETPIDACDGTKS